VTLIALESQRYCIHRQRLTDDELLALLHSAGRDLAEQMSRRRGPQLIVQPSVQQVAQVAGARP